MLVKQFTLKNRSGLHARPAALFVQTVQGLGDTEVLVTSGDRTVNARSLLSILSLGVAAGSSITLRCSGDREQKAMDSLGALIEGGFGEG